MIWKDIINCEGVYQVSDTGKVRSMDRKIQDSLGRIRKMKGRELSQGLHVYGYWQVTLSKGPVKKTRTVHQLVCEVFLGQRPEGMEVLHGPAGIKDNSLNNLRYGTKSQNAKDRMRDGTQHDRSKKVIREDGEVFSSLTAAAKASGATVANICSVCRGNRSRAGGFSWFYNES